MAKPAVPLAGRTLIESILTWLIGQGITDVVLNLHHKPETITAVVGDGAHLGLRVRYSWEQPLLGSAGGPRHALALLDSDPFLIVNGDTLTNVAIAPMREAFDRSGADVLMAVVPNRASARYNGMRIAPHASGAAPRVLGFVPKGPDAVDTWHFVGVQIVRPSVFAGLEDGVPAETVTGIYRQLVGDHGRIHAWPIDSPFLDVGTPADYLQAALDLASADGEPGGTVDPSAMLTDTVVWPAACVGARARLDRCIVAGPVVVPADFAAHECVIAPASIAHAGDDARIEGDIACIPIASRT